MGALVMIVMRHRLVMGDMNHRRISADRGVAVGSRTVPMRVVLMLDCVAAGITGMRTKDGHQAGDNLFAVEEDAEDSQRKQDRADRQIVSKTDSHCTHSGASASCRPCPEPTLRTLIASSGVRAFCTLMS